MAKERDWSIFEAITKLRQPDYEDAISTADRLLVKAVFLQLRAGKSPHPSDVEIVIGIWKDLVRDLGAK